MSAFLVTAVITGLTPVFTRLYRIKNYDPLVDEWNREGSDGKYSREDVSDAHEKVKRFFNGFLSGGIAVMSAIFVYSFIDGIVNMNRIDKALNNN